MEECAAGATVVLSREGAEVARATTDTFGEFRIDRLATNSGRYALEVASGSDGRAAMHFELGSESLYLGVIPLSTAA